MGGVGIELGVGGVVEGGLGVLSSRRFCEVEVGWCGVCVLF